MYERKNLVDGEEIARKIWFLKTEEEIVQNKIRVLVADDDKNIINIIRYSIDSDQFEF